MKALATYLAYYTSIGAIIYFAPQNQYAANALVGLGLAWFVIGLIKISAWLGIQGSKISEEDAKKYQKDKNYLMFRGALLNFIICGVLCVFGHWFALVGKALSLLGSCLVIGEQELRLKEFIKNNTAQ